MIRTLRPAAKAWVPILASITVCVAVLVGRHAMAASAHNFEFDSIDGQTLPLANYAGHPVLIVNTASFCGFTHQYEGLQALWQTYRDRGLVVLAVPSNDFGGQEPHGEAEIKTFCETNFNVDFPLTAKQKVIGSTAHPFYRWIADELGEDHAPRWNFHKYLVAPDGHLAGAWPSQVAPESADITGAIEAFLAR